MRLYLSADSKEKIGYVPDWIRVRYSENNMEIELTLDIQGEISYFKDKLECRCKGDLIPWELMNFDTGDNPDLSLLSSEELDEMFPPERIAEIFCESDYFEVGIYPEYNGDSDEEKFELANKDVLTNCKGLLEIYDGEKDHTKEFSFEVQLNI